MITLFIDTSTTTLTVALIKDDNVLEESTVSSSEHSKHTMPEIEKLFKNNNIEPRSVNKIMVTNGPGSFTGIRIGVTIAKIFAYLQKIRIVSITSLLARVIGNDAEYLLSTIDAKHNNYYIGLYDYKYNKIIEKFANINELEEIKNKYSPLVIDEEQEYNINEIIKYTKKLPSQNAHSVNPIYLKLPEAMEKK